MSSTSGIRKKFTPMDLAQARENMVENQIRPNKVIDKKLIETLKLIPREEFVPEGLENVCYVDEDIEIIENRFLMEPTVFARLVQEAQIKLSDIVLDIGCLLGYSTAVLSQLADTVIGLENEAEIVNIANENTSHPLFCNAAVVLGELDKGFSGQAPYNVIFIQGAVAQVPDVIFEQLENNGRLLTIVRKESQTGVQAQGVATLFTKMDGRIVEKPLFDAAVPYLQSFEPKEEFKF